MFKFIICKFFGHNLRIKNVNNSKCAICTRCHKTLIRKVGWFYETRKNGNGNAFYYIWKKNR